MSHGRSHSYQRVATARGNTEHDSYQGHASAMATEVADCRPRAYIDQGTYRGVSNATEAQLCADLNAEA